MIKDLLCWSLITLQGIMIFCDPFIRNRILMISGQIWPCRSAQIQQLGQGIRMFLAISLIPAVFGSFWVRVYSLSMYAVYICNFYNPLVSKGVDQSFFIQSSYDILLLIYGLILIIQEIDNTFGPQNEASTTISRNSSIRQNDVSQKQLKVLNTNSQGNIILPESSKSKKGINQDNNLNKYKINQSAKDIIKNQPPSPNKNKKR